MAPWRTREATKARTSGELCSVNFGDTMSLIKRIPAYEHTNFRFDLPLRTFAIYAFKVQSDTHIRNKMFTDLKESASRYDVQRFLEAHP